MMENDDFIAEIEAEEMREFLQQLDFEEEFPNGCPDPEEEMDEETAESYWHAMDKDD
jgi:hypothetical protein